MPGVYQLLPALSEEEFAALKADIREHGIQVPIEFDEEGNVLDGYHRLQAARELGIPEEAIPRVVRTGLSEEQKREHVLRLNVLRRQLSRDQKMGLALDLRRQGWTQSRIAHLLGVGQGTVSEWLQALADVQPDAVPDVVVDSLGRPQPARKPRRVSLAIGGRMRTGVTESPEESAAETREDARDVTESSDGTATAPEGAPEPGGPVADTSGSSVEAPAEPAAEADSGSTAEADSGSTAEADSGSTAEADSGSTAEATGGVDEASAGSDVIDADNAGAGDEGRRTPAPEDPPGRPDAANVWAYFWACQADRLDRAALERCGLDPEERSMALALEAAFNVLTHTYQQDHRGRKAVLAWRRYQAARGEAKASVRAARLLEAMGRYIRTLEEWSQALSRRVRAVSA